MISDPALRNDWHVVHRSRDLDEGAMQPVHLLGEDLVLWSLRVRGRYRGRRRWPAGAVRRGWLFAHATCARRHNGRSR